MNVTTTKSSKSNTVKVTFTPRVTGGYDKIQKTFTSTVYVCSTMLLSTYNRLFEHVKATLADSVKYEGSKVILYKSVSKTFTENSSIQDKEATVTLIENQTFVGVAKIAKGSYNSGSTGTDGAQTVILYNLSAQSFMSNSTEGKIEFNLNNSSTAYIDKNGIYSTSFYASSDRQLKDNIIEMSEKTTLYDELFERLKPVEFEFKNDLDKRTHLGFIAQDVATTFGDSFGIVNNSDSDHLRLNYLELIALNTLQIKSLKKQVAELIKRLAEKEN